MTWRGKTWLPGPLIATLVTLPAHALPTGVDTPNCDGCHAAGGFDGTLTLAPDGEIQPGETANFTLTVTESQALVAGVFLTAYGVGTLAPGSGTREIGVGITHSRPFEVSDGRVQIPFTWTAPSGQGGVDFLVAVVAADGNGEPANDRVARTTISAVWGCDGITLFRDIDADGFGDDRDTVLRCAGESGWSEIGGDCVDFRDTVYPGAAEVANGRDDDCNGEVDEGITTALLYPDRDGDGFGSTLGTSFEGELGTEGYSPNAEDCDDLDPATNPDAEELCDGRDQNCNDELDEGSFEYCGVGRCLVRLELCDHECVPLNPFVETCNGLDDDCDGVVDNGDLCAAGEVCALSCIRDPSGTPASASAAPAPECAAPTPNANPPSTPTLASASPSFEPPTERPTDAGAERSPGSPTSGGGATDANATPSPPSSTRAEEPPAASGCAIVSVPGGAGSSCPLGVLCLAWTLGALSRRRRSGPSGQR